MCDDTIPENKSYLKINGDFKTFCNKQKYRLPLIRLHYGPLEKNGFIKHKPQKLHGLIGCLKKLNYDVEVIPAAHLNVLKVVILGHDVYRMNMKFLEFNIDCCFDKMCATVVQKIQEATKRLYDDRNIAKDMDERLNDLYKDLSMDESYSSDIITSITPSE